MGVFRYFIVMAVFAFTTYLTLNWVLDRSWDWAFIGYLTISVIASIGAIILGSLVAHVALTLLRKTDHFLPSDH